MLFKITDEKEAGNISKEDIKIMIDHYRDSKSSNLPPLKYAHFRLEDLLEFFMETGALHKKLADLLKENEILEHSKKYGLKIYLGRHKNLTTIPTDGRNLKTKYLDKATPILLNTIKLEKGQIKSDTPRGFKDIFSYGIVGSEHIGKTEEYGLDKAEIEPPYHDGGYFDIGEEE